MVKEKNGGLNVFEKYLRYGSCYVLLLVLFLARLFPEQQNILMD